jgi:hypothetical protein
VRPIDVAEREHRSPPPLVLVVALLAIGGLIGWGAASFGGDTIATVDAATDTEEASPLGDPSLQPETRPTISWIAATTVPEIPGPLDYAGASNVAEVNGLLYVVVRFVDPTTMEISNHLWSSEDGVEWASDVIDVGAQVSITEVTAVGDGLLMTGRSDSLFGMWRSIPDRGIDGTSWSRVAIDLPDDFSPRFHATAANQQGEITTAAIGTVDLWREIVAPYLPPGIDGTDPNLTLAAGILYSPGEPAVPLFSEPPEVVTTGGNIWIRLVTLDGEEVLQTRPLPAGAYPLSTTADLADIPIALSWISDDGIDFLPITGRNALPDGYFLPAAWQDGFITASYELGNEFAPDETVSLWTTGSGRAWDVAPVQPPRQCSPFFVAVNRDRVLLTAEDGTRCVGTNDGEWTVLAEPSTVSYAVGGGAGFLGYPDSFDYQTASFSRDGENWVDITIPAAEPYPTLEILERRLLAMSVNCCDPTKGKHIDVWIGNIS